METINIHKREVTSTKRNGRLNESGTTNTSTASFSSSGAAIDWAVVTADLVTINRDTHIEGTLTASEDVIAYIAGAVSSDVLSLLTCSYPLVKTALNLALQYNSGQFELINNELSIKTSILGGGGSVDWTAILNKPTFATVATTGSYNDLTNKPTFTSTIAGATDFTTYFTGLKALAAVVADSANAVAWTNVSGKPTFFSGSYTDLTNKPTIINTIAGSTDAASYFTGTKALTASVADSANAVTWTNVSSKPTTFTPAAHTLASHSDIASYFTGTKALTASLADSANAVTWTNVSSKPSTFTPSAHTLASHSDITTYFSGTKALTAIIAENAFKSDVSNLSNLAVQAQNSAKLVNVDGANFYHSGNFNKTNVSITASTLTANNCIINNSGNGAELLKFNTERAWNFTQYGTGSTSELRLNDLNGSKIFRIVDTINAGNVMFSNGNIAASNDISAQTLTIKNGASTVWTVTFNGTDIVFKNSSGVNKCKVDQTGNLTAAGDITAFGSI